MCDACEAWEIGAPPRQAGIDRDLARRARAIECAMPGERVPETAWRIIAGQEGGAIAWADHRRILTCLDMAVRDAATRTPFAAARRAPALRCEATP